MTWATNFKQELLAGELTRVMAFWVDVVRGQRFFLLAFWTFSVFHHSSLLGNLEVTTDGCLHTLQQ